MTAAHHHLLHRYSVHSAALVQSTERTFLSLWVCLVTVCRRSKNSCCCTTILLSCKYDRDTAVCCGNIERFLLYSCRSLSCAGYTPTMTYSSRNS